MWLLERYLDGQHEQVWTELLGIGPSIRDDPDEWADAHQTTFVNYLRTVMRFAGMGGMGEVRHHGHDLYPTPPEVERLAAELERF